MVGAGGDGAWGLIMVGFRAGLALAAGAVLLCGVAGCDRGGGGAGSGGAAGQASVDPSPAGAAEAAGRGYGSGGGRYGGGRYARNDREAPTPMFHGEPMWSANRSHTAEENAEYH